jgi:hypothetical protein
MNHEGLDDERHQDAQSSQCALQGESGLGSGPRDQDVERNGSGVGGSSGPGEPLEKSLAGESQRTF